MEVLFLQEVAHAVGLPHIHCAAIDGTGYSARYNQAFKDFYNKAPVYTVGTNCGQADLT